MSGYNVEFRLIRELINKALSANELNNLIFDMFPNDYEELSSLPSLQARVLSTIILASKRNQIPELLDKVRQYNPSRYESFEHALSVGEPNTGAKQELQHQRTDRIEILQDELSLRMRKLKRLRTAFAIETDPSTQFKLEENIKSEEEAIAILQNDLDSV